MIREPELEVALSRHIARTLTNQPGPNAMAIDLFDAGVCPDGVVKTGYRYADFALLDQMSPRDAAAAGFAAGVAVGRTAREEEGS